MIDSPRATRWAVFSDTHGNRDTMRDALGAKRFDAIIHLGDGVRDAEAIARERGIPLHCVAGNEDGGCDRPERLTLSMGPVSALIMHGHRMDVTPYLTPDELDRRINSMEALMELSGTRLLLFGHTHVPLLRKTHRGIICNPGSHYIGSQVPHTYAVIEASGTKITGRLLERRGSKWVVAEECIYPESDTLQSPSPPFHER